MELERDLHQLTDVRFVVYDEYLRDPFVVCHHHGAFCGLAGRTLHR
jgi:hypothetical protein